MKHYILGGQSHLPNQANDFHSGKASPFRFDFDKETDAEAITEATRILDNERVHASQEGCVVQGTLWCGSEVIKNFEA